MSALPLLHATRYVEPLREGGSLPALMEADDLGTYVVKFRGAGQGTATLCAEIVTGELGRRLGVPVPGLALIEVDPAIGRLEPDPEVQDLLLASAGTNLAMDFLPRALGYDAGAGDPDPDTVARILWLDALTVNVDRSWRNPNLLLWHGALWAIDHGASLLFQHTWPGPERFAARAYDLDQHVLGPFAGTVAAVDAELRATVTPTLVAEVLDLVPDAWLPDLPDTSTVAEVRQRYADYLLARVDAADSWVPRRPGGSGGPS